MPDHLIIINKSQIRRRWLNFMLGCLVSGAGLTFFGPTTSAQFREPSAPPPGGRSGVWIDTSSTAQIKTGSLIIGDQSGGDVLCLNGSDLNNWTQCVPSWTALSGANTDGLVKVYHKPFNDPAYVPAGNASNPSDYQSLEQRGYAYLRGDGNIANHTIGADAGIAVGTTTGVFAGDGSTADPIIPGTVFSGYAAYFSGRVRVSNDFVGNPGELCLNSTLTYSQGVNSGHGCISNWNQLAATLINPYIKLQLGNPPAELQFGTGRIGATAGIRPGTWMFQQGAVVGGVSSSVSAATYLGDGLCSPEIGEVLPASDCAAPPPAPAAESESSPGLADSIVPPF